MDDTAVPVWQDDASSSRVVDVSEPTIGEGNPDDPNGGITDPNSDPDGDKPSKTRRN